MADDFEEEIVSAPTAKVQIEEEVVSSPVENIDFEEELVNGSPGPLEQARQAIRGEKERQAREIAVRAQIDQEQAQQEAAKDADPRNWSSTRFKKDMPKPRTPQDQAFYDATLQDIKEREKGLTEKILTDIFGRPAAAHRESIRAVAKGEGVGKAYERGAADPEGSETFQNELIRKTNEGLDPKVAHALSTSLGPVAAILSPEDRETVGRFIAGVPASTLGLVADTATNPAELLITILGQKALKYVAKIPAGARTVGERATAPIGELFTKKPLLLPTAPAKTPIAAQKPAAKGPSELADKAEDLYQHTFNRLQSLENLAKEAKAKGYVLKPGEDPGLRSRSYLGVQPKVQSVLEDKTFRITPDGEVVPTGEGLKPILKDFDRFLPDVPRAAKEKDLVEYLKARRIVEDLQRLKPGDSGEMIATPEQVKAAKATLADIKTRYGAGEKILEDTATRLYGYQKRVLETLVDSGNLSKKSFSEILDKNPNYVPFDRVLDDVEFGGVLPRTKERFSGASSPVRTIKGSEREIHDPIESMIKNTHRIMDVADRNTVARSVAKLANVLPEKIRPLKTPMKPISVSAAETGGEATTIFRPSGFKPKGNVVEYFEDGKRKYIQVSDNIADAMRGLNEQSASILVKVLSMPANWLRSGATLTPEFMARNPLRDQFTALIQTKLGYKPIVDSTGAIADILGKKSVYYDWLRSGGGHSTITELSRENLKTTLSKLRGNKSLLSKLNIITHAQDLSQLMEQATRLGVYKAARQKGLSAVESGFQSREATVDFARIGSSIKEPNRLIAFFNANLQGLDKTFRTAAADPKGLAVKGTGLITAPSVLLYLLNRQDPDYRELPNWQKNLFWMFKWPGSDTYVRIPKPFLYGQVFGSAPERFLEYVDTKDPRAIESLKKSLVGSLSPVAGDPENITELAAAILPTALKPIIENFANKSSFLGRPIVPESKKDLRPSEQYGRSTTETAKAVGKALEVSPAKFENLVGGYGGGLGRYALQLGDKIMEGADRLAGKGPAATKPTEVTDIPLVKGFTSRAHLTSPESVNEFYESRQKAETDYKTAKELYEQGDEEGAKKVLKDGDAEFYKLTQKAGQAISKLNTYADELVKSGKHNEAELKKKLAEVDRQQLEIARKVNKVISAKKNKSSRS